MDGLPRSVEQDEQAADELWRARYGQAADDNERDPENAPGDDASPDGDSADDPASDPAAQDKPEADADYWRRRFETMQGKYHAEVSKTAQDNRHLRQRAEQAESRAADLERRVGELESAAPVDVSQHFSQEERDQFGDETLAMMHRHANAVADKRVQEARNEMNGQFEDVRASQQERQANDFVASLSREVPDWETVNGDPAFHRWLEQTVPVHTERGRQNLSRQHLLEQYEQAGNARDVIEMFHEFKAAQQGEQTQQRRQREAPPKSAGGNPLPTDDGPAWITQNDIDDFYMNQMDWERRDPKAAAAREREIERAVQAGRVK